MCPRGVGVELGGLVLAAPTDAPSLPFDEHPAETTIATTTSRPRRGLVLIDMRLSLIRNERLRLSTFNSRQTRIAYA
jgi:hypothetical protein